MKTKTIALASLIFASSLAVGAGGEALAQTLNADERFAIEGGISRSEFEEEIPTVNDLDLSATTTLINLDLSAGVRVADHVTAHIGGVYTLDGESEILGVKADANSFTIRGGLRIGW